MDKYYIITNTTKDPDFEVTRLVSNYLKNKGKECMTQETLVLEENEEYRYTNAEYIPKDIECVLVLGGDGTLIQAARDLVDRELPLLGINLGTLGYLAEIDMTNIIPAMDSLTNDEFSIEKRMMLEGTVYHGNKVIAKDIALNDIVIGRNGHLRIININIYVDGKLLNSYSADGMIVSTPTGSTGYSLSAGGPIVSPSASIILLTPIAPHTLNTRSIVLSHEGEIVVELGKGRKTEKEEAEVTFDGDNFIDLETGDRIVIKKSKKDTNVLKISNISFLEVLREKMKNN
jgi:NAD+ kinase